MDGGGKPGQAGIAHDRTRTVELQDHGNDPGLFALMDRLLDEVSHVGVDQALDLDDAHSAWITGRLGCGIGCRASHSGHSKEDAEKDQEGTEGG